jgi:P-aminobenzoate N-oxygenase AurF
VTADREQAEAATRPTSSFLRLTERLSEASVRRRWEAYRDIDWEAPEHQLDPEDPRWELPEWDPVGASDWYRDQAPEQRVTIGRHRQAEAWKVGIEFERALSGGLLIFASRLPNQHPALRYVYHEISEEAQHTMMFQELINRSGADPMGADEDLKRRFQQSPDLKRDLPVLFFLAVLAGEEAFDFINRQMIRSATTHPLIAKASRIHVIEESRHVSFARAFLRHAVPRLDARRIRHVRYEAPFALDLIATYMFDLTASFRQAMEVPDEVYRAISEGPVGHRVRSQSIASVVALCHELGLVDPRLATLWARVSEPSTVAAGSGGV